MKRVVASIIIAAGIGCCSAPIASAHPLDVAYLDFSPSGQTGLTLTVAIHPYQAYELVRGSDKAIFDIKRLQARGDLVSAYAEDHVALSRDGRPCTWDAQTAHTPDSELDAVADGVTISGPVQCPFAAQHISAMVELFLDGFPTQTNILRLELPEGFADRLTLDRTTRFADLDLAELYVSSTNVAVSTTQSVVRPRTPDAALMDLAKRALDPALGTWGFFGVLLAVALVGALHALGPGHGKSLMAATMVGTRATYGRVLLLGTVMTVTHVSDVFVMAILAGLISGLIPQTTLLQYLSMVSAFGLIVMGAVSLWRAVSRYRLIARDPEAGILDEAHRRAHELGLPHRHEPAHEPHGHDHHAAQSFRDALWMGFLGALAPCPSAWAVFLATLATGHVWTGIALLLAFTVGLHLTILIIGGLIVTSKSFALRRTPPKLTYALPIFSSCLIIGLGSYLLSRGS